MPPPPPMPPIFLSISAIPPIPPGMPPPPPIPPMFFKISSMPPMPPGVPPPPPPCMFFSISAIPPMPPIPVPPPATSPNGFAPPGPPCCRCCWPCFFLGPGSPAGRTSTSTATASSSLCCFLTPSTRASAKALANSLFSKKLLVETPQSFSNSFFMSPAFISCILINSFTICCSRGTPLSGGEGDGVFAGDGVGVAAVGVAVVVDCLGWSPSARAFSKALTNSVFSRKDLVDIP
mmetsp:Transcript_46940/g.69470  ORF Transcript_46940/g.69470 Transcript_46940/m.69470 type:complete len:234 (+) Transcript_46940:588-1289(+)